ncbi:flagellar hook-length control protein FliK [Mesorhizobium sp. NPDC059054]|uniref:flagellar hook-length control protein FliK n=1 Tax=Mesorhizobium sp. NPDC059054 TaxID=3346711 RepID=UPI0036803E0B
MTASIGQNLPGVPLQRTGGQQSGGKAGEDGPAFDDLLTHRETTDKDKATQHATHGSHWERIRADITFASGERAAGQIGESKARIDEEGDDEQADDKQSADTHDQTADARDHLPLFLNLHGLGRSQSDNRGGPDTAETDADALADKAKRAAVVRGTKDADTGQSDNEQSPTIHVDRSTATRGTGGVQAANTQNLAGGASAENATASAGSAVGEAELGGSGATPVEPSETEANGRRAFSETLKQSGGSRASVVAEQNYPAPALQHPTQASRDVIDAIASNGAPARAASTAAMGTQNGSPVAVPAHILKIELHPSELGAVTANLRLVGEQLSIEIKPETYEAHRRLSSDSEAIVKSLKSLGFDIDKVTILQPSIAATPAARGDAPQAGAALGRDQSSFQPGNSGGNGDGMSGQSGRNRGDDRQQDQRPAQPSHERSGSDLFI